MAPIETLTKIIDAVGAQSTVIADSGVQRGSDVLKLLAVGAKAVMVGRSLLYGTAVGGAAGASQMIGILRQELDIAMALTGCQDIRELDRSVLEMPRDLPCCCTTVHSGGKELFDLVEEPSGRSCSSDLAG
ncbi:hypothetical protein AJ87_08340 [Rhizobium yanglingense]|nr:hypothetical protein AJ87_08340 [Rhizobium yanglingense]